MINSAPKGEKRARETKVINEMLARHEDGTLSLNLDAPQFEEAKDIYKHHVSKQSTMTKP